MELPLLTAGCSGSLPSRGAWIEIGLYGDAGRKCPWSLPSRGAWIEMLVPLVLAQTSKVAPLTGSVDRNP